MYLFVISPMCSHSIFEAKVVCFWYFKSLTFFDKVWGFVRLWFTVEEFVSFVNHSELNFPFLNNIQPRLWPVFSWTWFLKMMKDANDETISDLLVLILHLRIVNCLNQWHAINVCWSILIRMSQFILKNKVEQNSLSYLNHHP